MANELQDFMKQAGGFLETFAKVMENGFFSDMNVRLSVMGPVYKHVNITAVGYIPSDKANMQVGLAPYVDPNNIIEGIRRQITEEGFLFKRRLCKVETKDWPEWDEPERNIIGRFGTMYNFELIIDLENPDKVTD